MSRKHGASRRKAARDMARKYEREYENRQGNLNKLKAELSEKQPKGEQEDQEETSE